MPILERDEYIEQAYFYRSLAERMQENVPVQELLEWIRAEVLATTRLPMAISFLAGELRHTGMMGAAMARLSHYFAPFQTYLVNEAEHETGRFDMRVALAILQAEAKYRAADVSRQGLFLFQFECLCRNRLRYDSGLKAIADDPFYDEDWRKWVLTVRRQIGLIDFADLVFVRSQQYQNERERRAGMPLEPEKPILFGEKEGRIAQATRQKNPLLLFAALQRHLNYPAVPRPTPQDAARDLLPQMLRRMERLEARLKMLEEENRLGSIDLTKHFGPPPETP